VIELFDAARLLPRRDHSLSIAAAAAALGLLALGAHGYNLQRELNTLQAESRTQVAELAKLKAAAPPPTQALLADMEQLARRLESEVAAATGGNGAGPAPTPSQWLARLDALGNSEVGLSRIEIDRAGSARIEGVAKSPQAMSGYVQAWERENAPAPMRARAIEVRQDDKAAPLLRFQMRANLPGPAQP
jgi:hypothetical protein